MSNSPARSSASLEHLPSTTSKLLPGEELPGVLRCSPRTITASQSCVRSPGVDPLERLNRTMTGTCLVTLPPSANVKSKDGMMEDFTEVLQEKIILMKLLLRVQEAYEEREIHLLRYLSQGDIERLVSGQNPFKDTVSIRAQYFQAVFKHNLRSFSVEI